MNKIPETVESTEPVAWPFPLNAGYITEYVDEWADIFGVDRLSVAMKEKLAKKRAEGRGGWNDPDKCTIEYLWELLEDHIEKRDPVDIANFAMMIFNWQNPTAPAHPLPSPQVTRGQQDTARLDWIENEMLRDEWEIETGSIGDRHFVRLWQRGEEDGEDYPNLRAAIDAKLPPPEAGTPMGESPAQMVMVPQVERRYRWWQENIHLLENESVAGLAFSYQVPLYGIDPQVTQEQSQGELMDAIADIALAAHEAQRGKACY